MASVTVTASKLENLRKKSKVKLPVSAGKYVSFKKGKSKWYKNVDTGEEVTSRTIENYKREGVSRESREKSSFLEYGGFYEVENFKLSKSTHYTYEYDLSVDKIEDLGSGELWEFRELVMRNYTKKTVRYSYAYVFELGDGRVIQTRTMGVKTGKSFLRKELDNFAGKQGESSFSFLEVSRVWLKIIEKRVR